MTAYGFDLDGTLTRPELARLANDLHNAGHQVYVITGGLADTGEWTLDARRLLLARLGVRYTDIVRVLDPDITMIGRKKGLACEELSISVMFDDSSLYLNGIRESGTKAVRLLVLP